jgi:hypothetical protein
MTSLSGRSHRTPAWRVGQDVHRGLTGLIGLLDSHSRPGVSPPRPVGIVSAAH